MTYKIVIIVNPREAPKSILINARRIEVLLILSKEGTSTLPAKANVAHRCDVSVRGNH
jgi:hypothetical protein